MPIFELEAGGKSFELDAPDMGAAIAAFKKFSAAPALDVPTGNEFAPAPKSSMLERAISPIMSLPGTYDTMRQGAQAQMSRGVDQLRSGFEYAMTPTPDGESPSAGLPDVLSGVGNIAAGGIGYVASPLNAAIRSFVGKPVQDVTGVPAEYTDFAAALAIPGIGMTKVPPMARPLKAAPSVAPTVAELKEAGRAGYKSPEINSLEVKPAAQENAIQGIIADLNAQGFTRELAPKTFGILETAGAAPAGAVAVTGQNITSLNRALNKARMSPDKAEREAARVAKGHVDNYFSGISPDDVIAGNPRAAASTFKEANANWAAASKAEGLDAKVYRAEMRASAANSGMNAGNTTRQRLVDILADPRQRMGYSPEQIDLMEQIVRGTKPANAIRGLGNMLGGGGGLGAVASAAIGGLATGGPGAIAPVIGHALRRLGNSMTSRDVQRLSEMIRADSPLGRRVAAPLRDWSRAVMVAERSPTPRNISRLTLASNNLSNNLKDAGISMAPNDLLRAIQGAAPGRTDEENP